MKMFRTGLYFEILEVEVEKSTPKTVVYKEWISGKAVLTRENKRSNWFNWHDTQKDAIDFMIGREQDKVYEADKALLQANADLGRLESLYGKRD